MPAERTPFRRTREEKWNARRAKVRRNATECIVTPVTADETRMMASNPIEMELPPMSNAFHCSAYKVAMSNRKEKNSLFQRSVIGMDAAYEVVYHDGDLGLRLEATAQGNIIVHSVKTIERSPRNTNVELISPGDILLSVGCISLETETTSIDDVVQLLRLQGRPLHLIFESRVAKDLKRQLHATLARLDMDAKTAAAFDIDRPSRELVFQTSLEMIIDFSFDLYAWFDPMRVVHLIVFDDVLLVTEVKPSTRRLRVKFHFPLDLLKARDLQSEPNYIPASFQVVHPSRTLTFVACDEPTKREALDALTMAIALAAADRNPVYTRGWQYVTLQRKLWNEYMLEPLIYN
ncbi:Aste57867_14017 [Aphanomyces stellatus]|uniref:Aste57867_14017 protein n=1 Tax=Aphanomyces stellatus TaxID=120398 RepID=A0A485L0J0_9STRA|nr:hypothetical protein As57867_013966 [Aphanomyces stellatus]VFT90847.1 Aste57867_14017 [Aphanomyces stellatus]